MLSYRFNMKNLIFIIVLLFTTINDSFSSAAGDIELSSLTDEGASYSSGYTNESINTGGIPDLQEMLALKPTKKTGFKWVQRMISCCFDYHTFAAATMSWVNGPLSLLTITTSGASTVLSTLAAAALTEPDVSRNLSIAAVSTNIAAAVFGSLKMFVSSRSATEVLKATDGLLLMFTEYSGKMKAARGEVKAFAEMNPENQEIQNQLRAWDVAVESLETEMQSLVEKSTIIKEHHKRQMDSQSQEQTFIMSALNTQAHLSGQITTDALADGQASCAKCLSCYDQCLFTTSSIIQGPLGLTNVLASVSSAVALSFSIYATGNAHDALVYSGAALSGVAMMAAALNFWAKSITEKSGIRIQNARARDANDNV